MMRFSPALQGRTSGVCSSARVRYVMVLCVAVITLLPQRAPAQEPQLANADLAQPLSTRMAPRAQGFLFRTPMVS
ncbi:MAG: hypothetical protein ACREL7_12570, partial [Longimicrobiales bacterium]